MNVFFDKSFRFMCRAIIVLLCFTSALSHAESKRIQEIDAAAADGTFSVKKLLMPGPLHHTHAKYEKQCDKCHGDDAPALCRDCHEEIDQDIKDMAGFHGKQAVNGQLNCRSCHKEHQGRQGDLLNFDPSGFDHSQTDYKLEGQHKSAPCGSCHLPGKKHREAPQACFDCHEKHDAHKGAFGKECEDCHTPKEWKKNDFDHSKTDFPLQGKHQETTCAACHPNQKFKDIPQACVSCHAVNDVHNGINGRECDKCHKEEEWKKLSFDHNKDTKFKLQGQHEKINCNACHTKPVYESPTSMRCVSCHANDDKHFGLNGKECESCHSVNGWQKQTFDHNIDTDFALRGKHENLTCESCHHASDKSKAISSACVDCHKDEDVHKGQLGNACEQCHNDQGFDAKVRFDHNLSRFPLVGLHAVTACDSCHATHEYQNASEACVSCHAQDDHHKKTLGTECEICHTPNDWGIWLFDHNKQTDFKLDGAHQSLACASCHKTPTEGKVQQSATCITCHAKDDEHNKRFGRDCEQCHVTEAFNIIRMQ
jgi:hypothetical protein